MGTITAIPANQTTAAPAAGATGQVVYVANQSVAVSGTVSVANQIAQATTQTNATGAVVWLAPTQAVNVSGPVQVTNGGTALNVVVVPGSSPVPVNVTGGTINTILGTQIVSVVPGLSVSALRVDGGACANNLRRQMQADLMGVAVLRPRTIETTALGAALLAGLHTGVFTTPDECKAQLAIERVFEPLWSRDQAESKLAQWQAAVGVPNAG
jgi:hypothetical protein